MSEVKAGYEENSKHFDTKIVFMFNGNRVVIHSYNSTQNMKVEGKGYLELIDKYLEPYFLEIISKSGQSITEYNRKVVSNLAKPAVRRSTRYKPVSNFKCKRCDHTFGNIRQLKVHKNAIHTMSFNSSFKTLNDNSLVVQSHSTCDNSLCEKLMIEDMTMAEISVIDVNGRIK